jgi:hypothetical protein
MLRNRCFVAGALVVVIGLSFVIVPRTPQAVAAPAPDTEAGFRGKVLLIRSGYGMEVHILEQVRVRQFGAQAFLLGKVVESTGSRDSLKGKTLWLNMMGITQMIECADVAAAKKTLKGLPRMGGYAVPVYEGVPAATPPAVAPAPVLPAPATLPPSTR